MKVMILLPVYKRPEVFAAVMKRWKMPEKGLKISLFFNFIVSEGDKFFERNLKTATEFLNLTDVDGIICRAENFPVAAKQNAGIKSALKFEWDYMMNFGSDDILADDYWCNFYPAMHDRCDIAMMDSVCWVDPYNARTVIGTYPIVGAGRLIRRNLIERTIDELGYLYAPHLNSGMDTSSQRNMELVCGHLATRIIKGDYVADIKTLTNINGFDEIIRASYETTEIDARTFQRYGDLSTLRAEIAG